MEMEYDAGIIYSQEYFKIEQYDDVKAVYDKVAKASVNAFEKHLMDWTKGNLIGRTQDDSLSTYYPRRRPSDGKLDFSKPAEDEYNAIRGQARPYPGAFLNYKCNGKNQKIYIWKAGIGSDRRSGEFSVTCGDGKELILRRVQMEGNPEMWAEDFFRENHRIEDYIKKVAKR